MTERNGNRSLRQLLSLPLGFAASLGQEVINRGSGPITEQLPSESLSLGDCLRDCPDPNVAAIEFDQDIAAVLEADGAPQFQRDSQLAGRGYCGLSRLHGARPK